METKLKIKVPKELVNELKLTEKTCFTASYRNGEIHIEIADEANSRKRLDGEYEEGYAEGYDEGYLACSEAVKSAIDTEYDTDDVCEAECCQECRHFCEHCGHCILDGEAEDDYE